MKILVMESTPARMSSAVSEIVCIKSLGMSFLIVPTF